MNLNISKLYLKIDKNISYAQLESLQGSKLDGLLYKSQTVEEALQFIAYSKSKNLTNLDFQVEVSVESRLQIRTLKQAGFSKVQLPGGDLFEKVPDC